MLFAGVCVISAQAQRVTLQSTSKKPSKAWEIGLGGSAFQFSRTSFSDFEKTDEGYNFDLRLSHAVFGGNIYLARELSKHFYLDLQGTAGFTTESMDNDDKTKWLFMVGPGLQWRLGEYFGSKHIDPYIRGGIGYMYKDFEILYSGSEGNTPEEMKWILENIKNKEGLDRKHLMPISAGVGLNMWLNDNFGIGVQADYLVMPYKNVANSIQGTARLIWRIGGESKKSTAIEYVEVDKIIEKIVERPVEVERIVEVPVVQDIEQMCDYFNNITFEFDKADLTPASKEVIEKIAAMMKLDTSRRYLITGFTDSRGSSHYNKDLSRRRAGAVVKQLILMEVPPSMLKSRGVGDTISYVKSDVADEIRAGERKVTLELITNMAYWNYLPDHSF